MLKIDRRSSKNKKQYQYATKSKTTGKSQYNYVLWGRAYFNGKGKIITEIIKKPYDPESGKIIEC